MLRAKQQRGFWDSEKADYPPLFSASRTDCLDAPVIEAYLFGDSQELLRLGGKCFSRSGTGSQR